MPNLPRPNDVAHGESKGKPPGARRKFAVTYMTRKVNASAYGKGETTKAQPKTGRNDPCPCGSGAKWKRCCLTSPSSSE